jgi:hypothetical protein
LVFDFLRETAAAVFRRKFSSEEAPNGHDLFFPESITNIHGALPKAHLFARGRGSAGFAG